MSGIGEAVGIIACVAAVVSAFRDGSAILAKIKERRKKRGGLPPASFVENELKSAGDTIEDAAREGVDHYGKAFEVGDGMSIPRALRSSQPLLADFHRCRQDCYPPGYGRGSKIHASEPPKSSR